MVQQHPVKRQQLVCIHRASPSNHIQRTFPTSTAAVGLLSVPPMAPRCPYVRYSTSPQCVVHFGFGDCIASVCVTTLCDDPVSLLQHTKSLYLVHAAGHSWHVLLLPIFHESHFDIVRKLVRVVWVALAQAQQELPREGRQGVP